MMNDDARTSGQRNKFLSLLKTGPNYQEAVTSEGVIKLHCSNCKHDVEPGEGFPNFSPIEEYAR